MARCIACGAEMAGTLEWFICPACAERIERNDSAPLCASCGKAVAEFGGLCGGCYQSAEIKAQRMAANDGAGCDWCRGPLDPHDVTVSNDTETMRLCAKCASYPERRRVDAYMEQSRLAARANELQRENANLRGELAMRLEKLLAIGHDRDVVRARARHLYDYCDSLRDQIDHLTTSRDGYRALRLATVHENNMLFMDNEALRAEVARLTAKRGLFGRRGA